MGEINLTANTGREIARQMAAQREARWFSVQRELAELKTSAAKSASAVRSFTDEFLGEFERLENLIGRILTTQETHAAALERLSERVEAVERTIANWDVPTSTETKIEALERALDEMVARFDHLVAEIDQTRQEANLPELPSWNPEVSHG